MLSNSELYRIWRERLAQLMPDRRYERYRLTNMLLLVAGMYKSKSVHLNMIARKLPIRVRKLSLVRRLRRMLAGGSIRVREWYAPVAGSLHAQDSGFSKTDCHHVLVTGWLIVENNLSINPSLTG